MSRRWFCCCIAVPFGLAACATARKAPDADPVFTIVRRIAANEARQGVAADEEHLFAIGDRSIGKYDKQSGARVDGWADPDDGTLIHLNSGAVIEGKLYCAHSNYPALPMLRSIEVFDAQTLRHVGSHPLGGADGSATWIDRHDGSWWVGFAHYAGRGGQPGRGPEASSVVRYDSSWNPIATYRFPAQVIERFGDFSNSGGAWGDDGLLYATGHDAAEVYVLRLPRAGSTFDLVAISPAALAGQGIAWDGDALYGIVRDARQIVELRRRADR